MRKKCRASPSEEKIDENKNEKNIPMTKINFVQSVPDSHWWSSLEMLLHFLEHYKNGDVSANYLIIGLENARNRGYQLSTLPSPAPVKDEFSNLDPSVLTKPMSDKKEEWEKYFIRCIESDQVKDLSVVFEAIWNIRHKSPAPVKGVEEAAKEYVTQNPSGYGSFDLNDAMDEGKLKGFIAGVSFHQSLLSQEEQDGWDKMEEYLWASWDIEEIIKTLKQQYHLIKR